jgi:hypothetical protein
MSGLRVDLDGLANCSMHDSPRALQWIGRRRLERPYPCDQIRLQEISSTDTTNTAAQDASRRRSNPSDREGIDQRREDARHSEPGNFQCLAASDWDSHHQPNLESDTRAARCAT